MRNFISVQSLHTLPMLHKLTKSDDTKWKWTTENAQQESWLHQINTTCWLAMQEMMTCSALSNICIRDKNEKHFSQSKTIHRWFQNNQKMTSVCNNGYRIWPDRTIFYSIFNNFLIENHWEATKKECLSRNILILLKKTIDKTYLH